jgi:hypothetical protein
VISPGLEVEVAMGASMVKWVKNVFQYTNQWGRGCGFFYEKLK